MTTSLFQQGIQALESGQHQLARALLAQAVLVEPENAAAWFSLSGVVQDNEQKWYCLERTLALDPNNHAAVQAFDQLGRQMLAAAEARPSQPVPAPRTEPSELPSPPGPAATGAAPKSDRAARSWLTAMAQASLPPEPPPANGPEQPPVDRKTRSILFNVFVGFLGVLAVALGIILAVMVMRKVLVVPSVAQVVSPTRPPLTRLAMPATRGPTATPTRPTTATPTPLPTPSPVPPTPYRARVSCPFPLPSGLLVECFEVTVPENRSGGTVATIRLPVARIHGRGSSLSPHPLVFLQGGPGAGALFYLNSNYAGDFSWAYSLLEGHDLIVFDQRGAGYSYPTLQCNEMVEAYRRDVIEEWSEEQRQDGYMEAVRACRDRLTGSGVRLASYTTAASAADVIDILDSLGYQQADLYGVSYGTRLAMTVMRDFPQRVHSAILDSPMPLQTNMYLQAGDLEDVALQALFQGCSADAQCRSAYPNLSRAYREAAAALKRSPVSLRSRNEMVDDQLHRIAVDDNGLRSVLAWGLRSPDTLALIPKVIYDAWYEDYAPLAYMLSLQTTDYGELALGAYISIECSDEILPLEPGQLAVSRRSDASIFLGSAGDASLLYSACQEWGSTAADPDQREALVSDIPTLILAGQYDPITPPDLGLQVAETLSRGYVVKVPGAGHVPSMDPAVDCTRQIIRAFLTDPTRQPDDPCLAALDSAPFIIPSSSENVRLESFSDPAIGVAGLRPAGWQQGEEGPGYLERRSWPLDPTRIIIRGAVSSVDYWLQQLVTGFDGVGFDEEPKPNGIRDLNGLSWNLYTAHLSGHPVDIALAQASERTILILMVSEPRERQVLFDRVFIPMVKAAVEER